MITKEEIIDAFFLDMGMLEDYVNAQTLISVGEK